MFSHDFYEVFKNTFFYRKPLVAVSLKILLDHSYIDGQDIYLKEINYGGTFFLFRHTDYTYFYRTSTEDNITPNQCGANTKSLSARYIFLAHQKLLKVSNNFYISRELCLK